MDWNLKAAPSWDLSELEQETFPNLDTVDGSSGFGDHHRSNIRGNFSVDLKLGQLGDSGNNNNELVDMLKETGATKPIASSSPSGSKRSRAAYSGSHPVSCLVDGCTSDLSACREYHRRHKVCELHSKTPQVTINGHKQRFCQQCSRFHSLEEFDEGKRSCRKRLDGHNRRRRKPQPEPLSRSGSFLSNYQGTQLLPFSSSLVYPSTTMVNPSWGGAVVKTEVDSTLHRNQQHHHLPLMSSASNSSSSSSYKGGKQFSLFHSQNQTSQSHHHGHGASVCQPLLNTISFSSETSGGNGGRTVTKSKMFCDRLTTTTAQIHDSDCALSLLSSSQTQQTSEIGLGRMVQQPNSISQLQQQQQQRGLCLHGNNNNNRNIVHPIDSVLVSNGSSDDHCPGMFQIGSDGSQGNNQQHQPPQTLPFHWQ